MAISVEAHAKLFTLSGCLRSLCVFSYSLYSFWFPPVRLRSVPRRKKAGRRRCRRNRPPRRPDRLRLARLTKNFLAECSGDRSARSAVDARWRLKECRVSRTRGTSAESRAAFGKRLMAGKTGRPCSTRKTFRRLARSRWRRPITMLFTSARAKRQFAVTPHTGPAFTNRSMLERPGKMSD